MYAIIRQEKIKSADSFNGRLSHNNRSYFSKNIDKDKTEKNIVLVESKYKNLDEFANAKKEQIRSYNLKHGTKHRMIQKKLDKKTGKTEYSSMAQEFIFTHSPNADLSEKKSIEYLKKSFEFIKNRFPDNEIIDARIHLDEKTPHIHIITSYFNEKECRFNQKELSKAKLTDINEIRKDFQEEVAKGTGLLKQDGSVVAPNEHKQANYEIGILKEQLKETNENAETSYEELLFELQEEYSNVQLLEKQVKELQEENKELRAELEEKDQEIEDLNQQLETLQKQSNAYYGLNQDLKEEINSLKSIINDLESKKRVLDDKSIELDTKNDSRPNMSIFDEIVKDSKELNQKLGIDQEVKHEPIPDTSHLEDNQNKKVKKHKF